MSSTSARDERGALLRFIAVGAANTASTGALLIALALVLPFALAYTICYALGLAIATVGAGRFVFRTYLSSGRVVRYLGVYLSVYAIGLIVARASHTWWGFSSTEQAVTVLAVTTPLNFLGGRLVFVR